MKYCLTPHMTSSICLSETETLRLIETLQEMEPLYQQLLSMLQNEKRLIIEAKTDPLVRCAREKEVVLTRLAQLEEERIAATRRLLPQNPSLTLKTLIPLVVPVYREKLASLHRSLDVLTASITELNQMNGILIERVLAQISDLFALLRYLTPAGETYEPTGEMRRVSSGRTIGRG